jgi:hypothetical protein
VEKGSPVCGTEKNLFRGQEKALEPFSPYFEKALIDIEPG